MIATIATCDDRLIKVSGPVSSGKTEALVQRCATLLAQGIDPARILVCVPTSFAAQAFRTRLGLAVASTLQSAASQITVRTGLDICLATLARPEVMAATGRTGRLITKFEYNFLLEDMKTLGQSRRELRSMLGFFYRNWAALTPEADWCFGDAETVSGRLVGMARSLGGVISQEAPYLCACLLKGPDGAAFRGAYDYVLIDDFQNLSHAEQTALCMHARTQVIITGNPNQTAATNSDYPYVEGFVKFERLRRNVTTFALDEALGNGCVQRMVNALPTKTVMDSAYAATSFQRDGEPVLRVKWSTPDEELLGLTRQLRGDFSNDPQRSESETCIVVPNKRLCKMYRKALVKRGFKVSSAGVDAGVGGDPRDTSNCPAMVAYVKLNLLANPQDGMAWRAWTGFDDYLTNSQCWQHLYPYMDARGLTAPEALAHLAEMADAGKDEPFDRAHVLIDRYRAGIKLINENSTRRGFNLLAAAGANELPEFAEVQQLMIGDETAQQLFALVSDYMRNPVFPAGQHVLRLSTYANMAGTSYEQIIAPGLVDGFMPNRNAFEVVSTDEDRTKVMDSERRAFYSACGKARRSLVLSYFTKCDLELAERTKMQVKRIRSEEGQRIALSRPSCLFDQLEDACPGSISGQNYLSADLLN